MNQSNMYSKNELERTGNPYWNTKKERRKNRCSGGDFKCKAIIL